MLFEPRNAQRARTITPFYFAIVFGAATNVAKVLLLKIDLIADRA
jgi:hypothetical protein